MSVRWVDRPPKALYASGRNLKWHLLQYLKRSPPLPALRNRNAESSYHCSKLFEQRLEFASASLYANSFVPIITLLYTKKKDDNLFAYSFNSTHSTLQNSQWLHGIHAAQFHYRVFSTNKQLEEGQGRARVIDRSNKIAE